jgi:hypothetical protein
LLVGSEKKPRSAGKLSQIVVVRCFLLLLIAYCLLIVIVLLIDLSVPLDQESFFEHSEFGFPDKQGSMEVVELDSFKPQLRHL